jgi:hypothetical protein
MSLAGLPFLDVPCKTCPFAIREFVTSDDSLERSLAKLEIKPFLESHECDIFWKIEI